MTSRPPVVVVTGASKGLGLAATNILLDQFNAKVAGLSRSSGPLQPSDNFLPLSCDVAQDASVQDAIKQVLDRFGHIDALILNAAVLDPLGRIADDDTPLSAWKSHFDINFFSLVSIVKAALPSLRSSDLGGRIIFVSSGAAVTGKAGEGPYNASKAAMNSLCRTLGEEEPDVVSVALRPGMVDTAMQDQLRTLSTTSPYKDYQIFMDAYQNKKLLPPNVPGYVMAALSLRAPKSMSGQFVTWNDEACKEFNPK